MSQIWSELPPIGLTGLKSWLPHTLTLYRASSGPPGTPKGPALAQNSTFWPQKGPNRAQWKKQYHNLAPLGPPRTSGTPKRSTFGQNGPFWCPWGPKRGLILRYFILPVVFKHRAFYSLDGVWFQISTEIIYKKIMSKKEYSCASTVCNLINVSHWM